MKKLIVLFLLVAGFSAATKADVTSVSEYVLNEATVEQLFDASEDVTFQISGGLTADYFKPEQVSGDDNKQLIAGIVALASWITGIGAIIPIHRFILGTDGKGFKIFCMYFCTLSGCGFILLVDGILLVMNGEGDKYINNSKFIMW
jgi:TM2 domain-containing membrane protein YozV